MSVQAAKIESPKIDNTGGAKGAAGVIYFWGFFG
jgi:hypothetical protein